MDLCHSGVWETYHLEDLCPHPVFSKIEKYHNKSVFQLFQGIFSMKHYTQLIFKKYGIYCYYIFNFFADNLLNIGDVLLHNADSIQCCIKNPFEHKITNIIEVRIANITFLS